MGNLHPNGHAFISDLPVKEIVNDFNSIPHFPCVLNGTALKMALSTELGGRVIEGGSCGGVALQRAHWILQRSCNSAQWRLVGAASQVFLGNGACIATDLVNHCDMAGLLAGHVRTRDNKVVQT